MKKLLNQNVKTKEESKILAKLHLKSHESFNKKKKKNKPLLNRQRILLDKKKEILN